MRGRNGARQVERFNPARAARLDDQDRFQYLPPARVVELLDIPPAAAVVDFGTGTGLYAIEIAERRPDVAVVAIDEQPTMLNRLRAKPRARRSNLLPVGEADEIAARAGIADRVFALNVLHELEDDALAGLRALINEDGFALIVDWNAGVQRPVGPPADHVYSQEEACERLRRFGFHPVAMGGFPYHYAIVCRLTRTAQSDGVTRRTAEIVDKSEVSRRLHEGALLIDVRGDDEWQAGHITDAIHIPLAALASESEKLPRDRDILLVCGSGNRSLRAVKLLKCLGHTTCLSVEGGMKEWAAAGHPLRQV